MTQVRHLRIAMAAGILLACLVAVVWWLFPKPPESSGGMDFKGAIRAAQAMESMQPDRLDADHRLVDESWRQMGGEGFFERITLWESGDGVRRRVIQRLEHDADGGSWEVRGEVAMAVDRLVVARADDGADWQEVEAMAEEMDWRVERASVRSHVARVVPPGFGAQDLAELERAKAEVAMRLAGTGFHVDWAVLFQLALTPNDPRYAEQWAWSHLGAPQIWAATTGAEDVVVAVVDSGIDDSHPELAGNIWRNPSESADGTDTSGSGYVDDIRGWNFAEGNADAGDPHGHGTGVAGIIGATGNNGFGVAGAAWRVRLMPLRVGQQNIAVEDIIDAIDYAVDRRVLDGQNVVAIQLSLGANIPGNTRDEETPLFLAVRRARDAGILCIAAAGNGVNGGNDNDALVGGEPNHYFPSDFDLENVISVAASTPADTLRSTSNFGQVSVDMAAPGEDILTTDTGGGFRLRSGTSFAAPHVTGLVALAAAWNPDLDAAALRRIAIDGGREVIGLEGYLANPVRVAYDDGFAEITRWPRILPTPEWEDLPFLRSEDTGPLPVVVATVGNTVAGVSFEIDGDAFDATAGPDEAWTVHWPPPGTGEFEWSVTADASGSRSVHSERGAVRVLAPFDFWKAEQFGEDFQAEAASHEAGLGAHEPALWERFFFGLEDGHAGGALGVPAGRVVPDASGDGEVIRLRFWQAEHALSSPVSVQQSGLAVPVEWTPVDVDAVTTLDVDAAAGRVLREISFARGPHLRRFYRLRVDFNVE